MLLGAFLASAFFSEQEPLSVPPLTAAANGTCFGPLFCDLFENEILVRTTFDGSVTSDDAICMILKYFQMVSIKRNADRALASQGESSLFLLHHTLRFMVPFKFPRHNFLPFLLTMLHIPKINL